MGKKTGTKHIKYKGGLVDNEDEDKSMKTKTKNF